MTNIQKQQGNFILSHFMKSDPRIFSFVRIGDLIEGTILEIGSKKILIDLGKHGTGAVYPNDIQNAHELVRSLKVDSKIQSKVIDIDNEEGYVELSISEAGREKAWAEIVEIREKDEPISVRAVGFNKGGLLTDINGIQAFIPISQLSDKRFSSISVENKDKIGEILQELVGEEISVKIIDTNIKLNKLIVSEKEAVEISSKEFIKNYEVGQIIEGIVSSVADFGVFIKFVDNPAVEGLIHVSELAWKLVENPKEIVKVDDVIKAKIIEIKDGKISLSLKALEVDPWIDISKKYKEGQETTGIVYSFNPFGAIVNLEGDIQGQLHITEFGGEQEMKKQLTKGEKYTFIIKEIKPEEHKIVLKLSK